MSDEPQSTTDASKKIKSINKEAVHQICSGQVVFDLAIAVKELVENSLDSGATTIEVKLIDYGKSCITICDDGSGILECDFEELCLKHHTSKLKDFSDLTSIDTFGFRGEALSSLCALGDVTIITKHSTCEHTFTLTFDKNGKLTSKEESPHKQGTTVHVKNIFKTLPVRLKEFERNIKKEFSRVVQVLYGYCLVSVGVKIKCTNSIGNKPPILIVSTNKASKVLENVKSVFGVKAIDGLKEIVMEFPNEEILEEYKLPLNIPIDFTWECYVSNSNHNVGRSCPDRQFFYVNGRPCDLTKISRLINHTYHKYNNKQYPFVFLNLKLKQDCADVNVTPDKRKIFFTQEQLILATLKTNLQREWESSQQIFSLSTDYNSIKKGRSKRNISPVNDSFPSPKRHQFSNLKKESKDINDQNNENEQFEQFQNPSKEKKKVINLKELELMVVRDSTIMKMETTLERIRNKLQTQKEQKEPDETKLKRMKYKIQLSQKNEDAEKELEKELTKDSFKNMQIIGQFNLGFIVTKLDSDLFIIDQHASDEKFRFEKLNNETKLKTQLLIVPKLLNLSTLNETILIDNQTIFEDNGFSFAINREASQGHRVKLIGMPVSGGWQFDEQDIEELIFLIKEDGLGDSGIFRIPRPSRIKQMLASRACRSAVMIGKTLNPIEMHKIVTQMSTMKNPWNCPHGRPTIRHLFSQCFLT
ncbi:mismatch repair endonuclease PMS2-like [Leptopilina heterotoma]|uniref:mismatch repair endonuclease PMS2-like n=1 Tax=Leptopilina heterotoma TaxID=63436 RepID=UPI001CA9704E|nr:mismatch repair endonuclease PMS2-like [Leptopilina heterotoma]